MRIQTKASITFLAISLLPLALIGGVSYQNGQDIIKKTVGSQFQEYAQETLGKIDRRLTDVFHNVRSWANLELMQDVAYGDPQGKVSSFLTRLGNDYSYFSSIHALDVQGNIIASNFKPAVGKNISKEIFFANVMRNRSNGGDVHQDPITKEWVVTFAFLIRDRQDVNKTIGVLCANWRIDALARTTLTAGDAQDQPYDYFMLVRGEGLLIYASSEKVQQDAFNKNLLWEGMLSARLATEGEEGYLVEQDYLGVNSLIGYDHSRGFGDFPGFGWAVLVLQDVNKAFVPVERLKFIIVFVGAGVALIVIVISLILTRHMTTPILNISHVASKVAQGDFEGRVDYQAGDEIGSLTQSFNSMIRDLKNQRAQLVEKNYVDNIIKSMSDCLLVIDRQANILVVNRATCALFGYDEEDLIGQPISKILSREPGNTFETSEIQEIIKNRFVRNRELTGTTSDGRQLLVSFTGSLMTDAKGKFQGIVCAAQDITERKQLQEQLLQSQKMDAVGKLAGGIAHDFNNILTIIITHADLLKRRLDEGHPNLKVIDGIQRAAASATRLTKQLLSFSRRQVMQPTVVDLNEMVNHVEALLMRTLGENIKLVTTLAEDLGFVQADQSYLEQVVMNLVVNARDAMPQGGQIVIETQNVSFDSTFLSSHENAKPGEYVLLAVSDTGHGMPEDVQKKMFEPFFTTKEKGKGTGLGLSTSYGIIKQLGGYIDVYSEVGHGTTFKIYFPRVHGTRALADNLSGPSTVLPRGTETILVVEDKQEVRDAVTGILTEFGYKVLQADNGMEALVVANMYSKDKIDLLLTDVVMPRISGKELANQITVSRPNIKIIFMSGYTDDAIAQHGVIEDGVHFLQKPFTRADLVSTVRKVLDEKD